jgi:uncharacterized protein
MSSFLSPAAKSPGRAFSLVDASNGRVIVPRLELAIDSATRRKGLLGRDGLDADVGLVIAPSTAVHTFFMRFSIDILFLTKAGRVVKIRANVGPRRLAGVLRGYAVLELPAGAAARAEITVGQELALQYRVEA